MKKTLLIGAALAVGVSAVAQNSRETKLHSITLNKSLDKRIDRNEFPTAGNKIVKGPNSTSAVCNPDPFTSSPNAFGVGGGVTTYKQNCFSYNSDLNAYLWTHRKSANWAFAGATSGAIQSTIYDVATSNPIDSTIIYRDSTNQAGARYPGGSFYNPAGNTALSNVWVMGSGPALPGGGFSGPWYSARKLTGTSADQTVLPANATQGVDYYVAPAGPFGNTLFPNTDHVQVGNVVMFGGDLYSDTASGSAADFNALHGAVIGKADFTGGGAPVWGKDSIVPGYAYWMPPRLGFAASGDGRLAFAPNGTTGYWVDMGRLATNYNNSADSMMAPVVYKTTNGGATWTPVLQGYDWNCKHPELMKNVGMIYTTPSRYWQMNFKHGIDVTCDGNGKLHLVGTMVSQVGDGDAPDSASIYSLTYTHDYDWYHPIIWDLVTDGTDWKTMLVDSVMTSYMGGDPSGDTTAAFNPVDDGSGGYLPYGARVQVGRSTDGMKIFYTWADSDPSVTGTPYNSQPDLMMKGYDVTSGMMTSLTNVTNGIGTCFFHMTADVGYFDATASKWVCPMVYSLPRTQSGGVYSSLSGTDHYFVNCGAYAAADYSITAVWNNEATTTCGIGVQTFGNFFNAVNAYPNPFSHSTKIVVSLSEPKALEVNVFDAIGNLVSVKKVNGNMGENSITFDGSNLSAGVYYYTVTAGYEKVTKKLVIQK